MKKSQIALSIIFLIICIDQCLKIWIKTNLPYGYEFGILNASWGRIHFIENDGMAFGMRIGGEYGKLLLTVFRIIAVGFIGYYLRSLILHKASTGIIISIALIFAGAIGNIIDSVFYGVIFDKGLLIDYATGQNIVYDGIASFSSNGYTSLLHGNVVDMFYFPIASGHFPDWVPLIGGNYFFFFRPVFNVADSAITIGVLSILLFNRSIFKENKKDTNQTPPLKNAEIHADNSAQI